MHSVYSSSDNKLESKPKCDFSKSPELNAIRSESPGPALTWAEVAVPSVASGILRCGVCLTSASLSHCLHLPLVRALPALPAVREQPSALRLVRTVQAPSPGTPCGATARVQLRPSSPELADQRKAGVRGRGGKCSFPSTLRLGAHKFN